MPDSDLPSNVGGQWSDVFDWPIIGIESILTPDGKILSYGTDELGQQGAALIYDVWDPATNTHYTLPNKTPTDMFCSAAIVVPSTGKIIITGGDARPMGHTNMGVADVNVFDYRDMSVSASEDGPMSYQRWYPTVVELANGKVLVLGGCDMTGAGVGMPELYTPGVGWKSLTGANSKAISDAWFYPRAWLESDGKVLLFTGAGVLALDPSGNGTLTKVADLPFTTVGEFPAVKFAPDKVLILDNQGGAWVMDMSGGVPTFQQTGSLGEVRNWSNAVVLADGSVMVSGGSDVSYEITGAHNEVQIWNPQTGVWTTGDEAAIPRLYHSTTILLPDATVLSLGGGAPGPLTNTNGEIYKPGYLFNDDGSLATRPVITDAPDSIKQQQEFTIAVDDASSITRLTFIKTGAVTHSLDMSSGMVDLDFRAGPDNNTLIVVVPTNSNVLAPGNWMLFAFNDHGTPSVAATISVGLGGEDFSAGLQGYVTESGDATYDAASDVFTLTPDAASKTGTVMSNDRIDLTQNFTITFSAFLGSKDGGGSGIAFVLQSDQWGSDAVGSGANAQGTNGIANGLAISLDTFRDKGEVRSDHTNFFDTDAAAGTTETKATSLSNLENSQWHDVTVSWDAATQTLTYWVDGKQGGTLSGDLASQYFAGSDYVHFGFTGATGSGKVSNLQQVKVTSVTAAYAPADAPVKIEIAQIGGGTARVNGNAGFDADKQVFTLTPDGASKTGAVMANTQLDLSSDFDITFNIFLGSKNGGSSGATFVLQADPNGSDAIGSGGAGLGASGIHNGLAIAFNTAKRGSDTTSLVDTDAGSKLKALTSKVSLGNVEDGHWHQAHVVWDAETQTLQYWVDGKLGGTLTGDIAAKYFGGSELVHFGFTGATGRGGNLEQVHVTQIAANGGHLEYGSLAACDCLPFIDTDLDHIGLTGSASFQPGLINLTPDAKSTAGAAFTTCVLDLHTDFSLSFTFYAGNNDVAGGGLAFVLQNDPLGGDALGGNGTALGAGGIGNGLGIALSMTKGADSTYFFDTDLGTSAGKLSPENSLFNLQDNIWHTSQVTWDASTQTLSYWVDGVLGGTLTGDLAQQYFGGSNLVHFGFTGSTGTTGDWQMVHVAELDANLLCAECASDGDAGHSHGDALVADAPITGSAGNDILTGGPGDDTLIGGLGADTLTGGAGHDHFAYQLAAEGGDTIKDFSVAEDSLNFSAAGFGGGLVAGQQLVAGTNFVADANPTATSDTGTFLFNTDAHDLAWDFDGSGAGAAVQIAHFDTEVSLTVTHFEIIA